MPAKLSSLLARRTRQPIAAAGIDWRNPLTRGLAHCLLPSAGLRDRVTGEQWVNVGVASVIAPGRHGMARDTRGGDGSLKLEPARNVAGAAQTHLLLAGKSSQSINGAGFVAVGSLADEQSFALISYDSAFAAKSADGQPSSTLSSVDPVVARPFVFAGDGAGSELYYAGDRYLSSAITPTPRATSRLVIFGDRYADGTYVTGGQVFLYAFWPRRLTFGEIMALSANPWQIFAPESIPFFTPGMVAVQYARPNADISNTGWLPLSGSDLYPMVDETVRDDATYIYTTTPGALCELALSDVTDPATSAAHLPSLVLSAPTGGGGMIVRLMEGASTRASWTYDPLPTTPTLYQPELSGGEADSITDYANMRYQFEAIT
ncbi:MAG: hypothetical protein QG638_2748 [Pseudomonadota bacterium]|nr:hypothetical protein [Pseudomonadota bacterium]